METVVLIGNGCEEKVCNILTLRPDHIHCSFALPDWHASAKLAVPDLVIPAKLAEEDEEAPASGGAAKSGSSSGGLLSAFVRSVATAVVGTAALTREDIAPALAQLKRKLMERNVAEGIAEKCGAAHILSSSLHSSPKSKQQPLYITKKPK